MKNNNILTRIILCILLIIFMYVSAACSVGEDKKNKDDDIDSYQRVEKGRINAFIDEAYAFMKAAEEKEVIDNALLGDESEELCFNINELIGEYIDVSYALDYSGIILKTKDGNWKIYLTNGTYTINGKTKPISTSDVEKGSNLSKTSC